MWWEKIGWKRKEMQYTTLLLDMKPHYCLEQFAIHQGGGDITEMKNSYYGFLLRFLTVLLRFIMEFYYGYYGTFLKDFIDSE